MERVLGKKVNFSNLVICSLSIVLTSCQITKETNREISRGVFQNHGFCGQAFPFLPTPSPFHFFCSRSNFRAVTQLETLATQAIFWQSLCTWVIFLVISAHDQFWTFNECDAMQNLPFHLLCKKKIPAARIHLLKRYLWHNLVHAIYQDTLGRISENSATDVHRHDIHICIKTCSALFQPSFLQTCMSLLHQAITEVCKSLIIQISTQNLHRFNKRWSIN